jgi:hypothetical protein
VPFSIFFRLRAFFFLLQKIFFVYFLLLFLKPLVCISRFFFINIWVKK